MLNVTLEQAAPGSLELHDVRNEVPRRVVRITEGTCRVACARQPPER